MQQACETCYEFLLGNIETYGVQRSELPQYPVSLEKFIKDPEMASNLFDSIKDLNNPAAPSHKKLQAAQNCQMRRYEGTAIAYRKQALNHLFLAQPLREILTAKNVNQLLKEMIGRGRVKVQVALDRYSKRMLTKILPSDLANLMPP